MPRDPVCGMTVDADKAIKRKIGDRTYYFCAESCARVYEAPEQELRAMKRRVAVTLLGVIAVNRAASDCDIWFSSCNNDLNPSWRTLCVQPSYIHNIVSRRVDCWGGVLFLGHINLSRTEQ